MAEEGTGGKGRGEKGGRRKGLEREGEGRKREGLHDTGMGPQCLNPALHGHGELSAGSGETTPGQKGHKGMEGKGREDRGLTGRKREREGKEGREGQGTSLSHAYGLPTGNITFRLKVESHYAIFFTHFIFCHIVLCFSVV